MRGFWDFFSNFSSFIFSLYSTSSLVLASGQNGCKKRSQENLDLVLCQVTYCGGNGTRVIM